MRLFMSQTDPLILVVDDDPSVRKLAEAILQRVGMKTVLAENASEAAAILKGRPLPDLMILDLMLPDISGLDFLKQVREKSVFDNVLVLILSALADPDRIREGLSAGADRYLTKPYLSNNLAPTIQEMLRTGRIRRT
jgi:two-component system, OmpR family, phosphate regulon response regulator PhoB